MKLRNRLFVAIAIALFICGAHAQSQFPCKTTSGTGCLTIIPNQQQGGWIVGEIRTFAFGEDSAQLINELQSKGWVMARGQSLIRKDFDELWKVIGTDWGAADTSNVFYLPDLRGLFLRGWNDGRIPPPNHQTHPYSGDPDAGKRVTPRPEAGEASGVAGANGDHVGSVQADTVGPHKHVLGNTVQFSSDRGGYELTQNPSTLFPCCLFTQLDKDMSQGQLGAETRSSNVYVAYFIFVGKPAQEIQPNPAERAQGQTGRVALPTPGQSKK